MTQTRSEKVSEHKRNAPHYGFIVVKAAQFVAWCLAVLVTVLSLVPPELRPTTGAPHNLEHIAIFAATGAAFGFGYSGRPFQVTFALLIFAGVIELSQTFVPGRHARLSDFIIDALAMCVAAVAASIVATTFWTHRI